MNNTTMTNKITTHEAYKIQEFLLLHDFNTEELYEEFFDHLASSFEQDTNPEKNMTEHLNKFFYDNGMETGLKKITSEKGQAYMNQFRALVNNELKSFLKWPILLFIVTTYLVIYALQYAFGFKVFLLIVFSSSLAFIVFNYLKFSLKYRKACKKSNKPYKQSLVNSSIINWAIIPLLLINSVNLISNLSEGYIPVSVQLSFITLVSIYIILSEIAIYRVSNKHYKLKPDSI